MSIDTTIHLIGKYRLDGLISCVSKFLGFQLVLDKQWLDEEKELIFRGYTSGLFIHCSNQSFEDDPPFIFSEYNYVISITDDPTKRVLGEEYKDYVISFSKVLGAYCAETLKDKSEVIYGYYELIETYDYRDR